MPRRLKWGFPRSPAPIYSSQGCSVWGLLRSLRPGMEPNGGMERAWDVPEPGPFLVLLYSGHHVFLATVMQFL